MKCPRNPGRRPQRCAARALTRINHTFLNKFLFHRAHRGPNRGHGFKHRVRSVSSVGWAPCPLCQEFGERACEISGLTARPPPRNTPFRRLPSAGRRSRTASAPAPPARSRGNSTASPGTSPPSSASATAPSTPPPPPYPVFPARPQTREIRPAHTRSPRSARSARGRRTHRRTFLAPPDRPCRRAPGPRSRRKGRSPVGHPRRPARPGAAPSEDAFWLTPSPPAAPRLNAARVCGRRPDRPPSFPGRAMKNWSRKFPEPSRGGRRRCGGLTKKPLAAAIFPCYAFPSNPPMQ